MSKANSTKVEITCAACGTPFLVPRSRMKTQPRFCSHKCRWAICRKPLEERFFDYIGSKTDTGCILWSGSKTKAGYGNIGTGTGKENKYAHRLSYELMVGPVPSGYFVCHHCDNPACINPIHLFLGTDADNKADMVSKNRQARGTRNGHAKLTHADIKAIRASTGVSQAKLARRFGVSRWVISDVVHRRTWKHL